MYEEIWAYVHSNSVNVDHFFFLVPSIRCNRRRVDGFSNIVRACKPWELGAIEWLLQPSTIKLYSYFKFFFANCLRFNISNVINSIKLIFGRFINISNREHNEVFSTIIGVPVKFLMSLYLNRAKT